MTDVHISQEDFNKYNSNGKIGLSAGYLQRCFEAGGYPGFDGVMQIVKGRKEVAQSAGVDYCYRVRINDGVFAFNSLIGGNIQQQVERELEALTEGTIIAVTDVTIYENDQKGLFIITGYKLLSKNHPIMHDGEGKAVKSHPGNADLHRGYHPTMKFEVAWPEAAEFAGDVIENQPPPSKMIKTENGSAAAPASKAAPPPLARKGPSRTEGGVMPIAAVTPYCNHIRIHGVVTRKEEMRTIPSKNMKIFNFEVTDAQGDCIRVCAFNETAESIASTIVENMGYYITGGTVRVANKQYNNTGHDYELTLRSDSKVEQGNAAIPVPKLTLKRVELAHIGSHLGNLVDVLVVVEKVDENCTEFTSRNGKELVKRELDLIDESSVIVRITLWGNEAKNLDPDDYLHKVVVFKGVTPREFQGNFSLSTGQATRVHLVPEHPGVANLFEWYANTRPTADVKSFQFNSGSSDAPRTIAGVTEMRFGENSDKGDYATLKAMITRINPANALYKGCSNEGCQKKVVESDGDYRCEKCNTTKSTFKWLYMMQFEIADETGQVYVTAFGDTAAKIVGKSADEVGSIKDMNEAQYNETFEKLLFQPKLWRVRCKIETYNEEAKQRLTVFSVDEINHDRYISHLEQLVEYLEEME